MNLKRIRSTATRKKTKKKKKSQRLSHRKWTRWNWDSIYYYGEWRKTQTNEFITMSPFHEFNWVYFICTRLNFYEEPICEKKKIKDNFSHYIIICYKCLRLVCIITLCIGDNLPKWLVEIFIMIGNHDYLKCYFKVFKLEKRTVYNLVVEFVRLINSIYSTT